MSICLYVCLSVRNLREQDEVNVDYNILKEKETVVEREFQRVTISGEEKCGVLHYLS